MDNPTTTVTPPAGDIEQLKAQGLHLDKVLIPPETLADRIAELGEQVSGDYRGMNPYFICVLKGAVFFASDLLRHVTIPCEIDFMAVSSYGMATESSGVVQIIKDLDTPIEDRNIIILEDIIDSGQTLSYLVELLQARRPKSLEICTLLDKPDRRTVDINCRYTGFSIPNEFVVGYGLDWQERFRNLDYIATLHPSMYEDPEE